jgi:hypothetical protein
MNLLVIAGRLSRHRFGASGTVAPVLGALATRGHCVSLLAASLDDPSMFASAERVESFEAHTTSASDWPLGFAHWARSHARVHQADAILSFSRIVGGDVWFPIEPTAGAWLGRARSAKSLLGLAYTCARHHGVARSLVVESLRRTPLTPTGAPMHTVIAVGPTSAGEAARLLTPAGLDDLVVQAPYFSILPRFDKATREELRTRTRRILGISATALVLFAAAPMSAGRELDDLFIALSAHDARASAQENVLVLAAKESFALHTRAVRCGAERHVKFVGRTVHVGAMLAAADMCALPIRAGGGARGLFESGATGRLAADALRLGRPLITVSGAHGYDLARITLGDASRPGLIVDSTGVEGWRRALRTATDERWLTESSRAAAAVGADLNLNAFVGLLEARLASVSGAKTHGNNVPQTPQHQSTPSPPPHR